MWLTPWAAKAAPDDRQLLAATPDSNPTTSHHDSIRARLGPTLFEPQEIFPEVACARLGPLEPGVCHTADHAQIQRLDSEKTPQTHRRVTHSYEVVQMKRIP